MTWHLGSSWDRITTTLRNDYYTNEVEPHITGINKVCKKIESHASLISQSQVQLMGESLQTLEKHVNIGFEQAMSHQDTWREDVAKELQGLKELIIGRFSHDNVAAMVERELHHADAANTTCKFSPGVLS